MQWLKFLGGHKKMSEKKNPKERVKMEEVIEKWLVVIGVIIVISGFFFGINSCQEKKKADAKARANHQLCQNEETEKWVKIPSGFYRDSKGTCAKGTPPLPVVPSDSSVKLRATTPATITADYGFSLEADAPIMVQYPGEKPFLFTPGGDCNQLPQPKHSGPKKFWDPKNPENGHIGFRIYRGAGRC